MNCKSLLVGLITLLCLNAYGQQSKTVSSHNAEVQALEETVSLLQAENKTMQEHLDYLEKEIELCREDVRHKESNINDNQSHWLTILSIVIGAIVTVLGIGLGIIAPIVLNYRNDRKQKKIHYAPFRSLHDRRTQSHLHCP